MMSTTSSSTLVRFPQILATANKGTFAWPETSEAGAMTIQAGDLALLLSGIDPARTKKRTWYERAA